MRRTRTIQYVRPWLYAKQEAVIFNDARFVICEASTKAGKTVACLVWLHEQAAINGGINRNFYWVAPVYHQAKIAFNRLKTLLPAGMFKSNESDMTVTLLNGSVIHFKSAVHPDHLYGDDVYAAVIDEASRCSHESYIAIRSTLTATRGPLRIIGNVKGTSNWMYDMARRSEAGEENYHYAKLTAYDAVEGGVLALEEVEQAKADLPSDVFGELYLAEPSNRTRLFAGTPPIIPVEAVPLEGRMARGWDFASTAAKPGKDPDYTVGVKLLQHMGVTYVLDVVRMRDTPDKVMQEFIRTALADGANCPQVVEQEPGASGKFMVEALQSNVRQAGLMTPVVASAPSGSKETRAYMVAAAWSDEPSRVKLVEGDWNMDFITEVSYFPHSRHDDQTDSLSHAYRYLSETHYAVGDFRVPGQ